MGPRSPASYLPTTASWPRAWTVVPPSTQSLLQAPLVLRSGFKPQPCPVGPRSPASYLPTTASWPRAWTVVPPSTQSLLQPLCAPHPFCFSPCHLWGPLVLRPGGPRSLLTALLSVSLVGTLGAQTRGPQEPPNRRSSCSISSALVPPRTGCSVLSLFSRRALEGDTLSPHPRPPSGGHSCCPGRRLPPRLNEGTTSPGCCLEEPVRLR